MKTFTLSHPQVAVNIPLVTREPIDICGIINRAHHPKAGGIVLFSGEVRNHHNDKAGKYPEYEPYIPMAEKMINEIVGTAIEK